MAQVYDKTDCFWSSQGDFMIGGDGDILDTGFDPLRSLVQEIHTRIESDQGDWAVFATTGSDLRDFIGEANNPFTAESIKTRIHGSLTRDGFINNRDISIQYMPIDRDKIMVRLTVKVAPTALNGNSQSLTLNSIYNYSDNNVYFFL
jgi:hypothetical protein